MMGYRVRNEALGETNWDGVEVYRLVIQELRLWTTRMTRWRCGTLQLTLNCIRF